MARIEGVQAKDAGLVARIAYKTELRACDGARESHGPQPAVIARRSADGDGAAEAEERRCSPDGAGLWWFSVTWRADVLR